MAAEQPLDDKFDSSSTEEASTEPRRRVPLDSLKPTLAVEAELRLIRAQYQENGKAIANLELHAQRLETTLQQHGEDSKKAMVALHARIDEVGAQVQATNTRLDLLDIKLDATNKHLDVLIAALKAAKPQE